MISKLGFWRVSKRNSWRISRRNSRKNSVKVNSRRKTWRIFKRNSSKILSSNSWRIPRRNFQPEGFVEETPGEFPENTPGTATKNFWSEGFLDWAPGGYFWAYLQEFLLRITPGTIFENSYRNSFGIFLQKLFLEIPSEIPSEDFSKISKISSDSYRNYLGIPSGTSTNALCEFLQIPSSLVWDFSDNSVWRLVLEFDLDISSWNSWRMPWRNSRKIPRRNWIPRKISKMIYRRIFLGRIPHGIRWVIPKELVEETLKVT